MLDKLSILGAVASALQIFEMAVAITIGVVARILLRLRDNTSLGEVYSNVKKYRQRLCEEVDDAFAYKDLRHNLDNIIMEIESLRRNPKMFTILRCHSLKFQDMFEKAVEEFNFQMSLKGNKERQAIAEYFRDVLESIKTQVERDGDQTRSEIAQSAKIIIEHGNINEYLTKIEGEFVPNQEDITWYKEVNGRSFRLWDLHHRHESQITNDSIPSARLDGSELSIIASINIDDVYQKRDTAVEFFEYLTRIKRRRGKDISPYVGLAKHGNCIHVLQIFSPPELVEQLDSNISERPRDELVQIINSLTQEFRFFLVNQFIKDGFSNFPDLRVFEDMQRSMLFLFAGNIEVSLSFCWRIGTQNGELMTHVVVSISRYLISSLSELQAANGYRVVVLELIYILKITFEEDAHF